MFICKPCFTEQTGRDDDFRFGFGASRGPCEVCKKTEICADIRSSELSRMDKRFVVAPGVYEVDGLKVAVTEGVALGLQQIAATAEVEIIEGPQAGERILVRCASTPENEPKRLEQVLSRLDANGVARPVVYTDDRKEYTVDRDHTSYDFAGHEEATRSPIFLLQKCQIGGINSENLQPSDTYHDGERLIVSAEMFEKDEIIEAAKEGELIKNDDDDMPFPLGLAVSDKQMVENDWVFTHWETVGVFRTRKEAEDWGHGQRHNLGSKGRDWRVYCIPCEGQLADIIKRIDRDELVTFIQTDAFKAALKAWREQEAQKL